MKRKRRREDLRSEVAPEELDLEEDRRSPLSEAGSSEERDRLILALMKLSERDRTILRLHLGAQPLEVIASETGLSVESARKALQRAVRRAREVVR